MQIIFKLRPMLNTADLSKEVKDLRNDIGEKEHLLAIERQRREKYEDELMILNEERNIMAVKLQSGKI